MWGRFKRMVRANLGRLSELGAGGGLTGDLEREARDLQRQFAELDKSLATFKGEVHFLEEKARKLARREEELDAIVRAADGRGSLAASNYGLELERVRTERATVLRQLETCRTALDRAQEMKRAYTAERDRKLAEARERERAMLELTREDAGDGARLAAGPSAPPIGAAGVSAPRAPTKDIADEDEVRRWEAEHLRAPAAKTVGADPAAPRISITPAQPTPPQARSVKTIGPESASPAPVAAAPALQIKVKPAKAEDVPPAPVAEPAPAPPALERTVGPAPDLVVELERLAKLREAGVLTDEELEQAKRRLLGA